MTFKESYIGRVDELVKAKDYPDVETRNKQVEDLIEEYYQALGEYPPSFILEKLANYIMVESLRSMNSYKMSHEEFPVMSPSQERTRQREVTIGDEKLDFFKQKRLKNPNAFRVRRSNVDE